MIISETVMRVSKIQRFISENQQKFPESLEKERVIFSGSQYSTYKTEDRALEETSRNGNL